MGYSEVDSQYDRDAREKVKAMATGSSAGEDFVKLKYNDIAWFFRFNDVVPEFLYTASDTKASNASSAARFNPVSALPGDAFQAAVAHAPSSKKKPKAIILDQSFFDAVDGEFKDQLITRRIKQINQLKESEGFKVYCKDQDGSFQLLTQDIDVEAVASINSFEEFDYEGFCDKFSIARDHTAIFDEAMASELNTLFCRNYEYLTEARNVRELLQYSDLRIAVELGDVDDISKIIEQDPSQLGGVDYAGVTPLYVAAQNGHVGVVDALTEVGAVVDQARDNGETPLYVASQSGHIDTVAALIAAKADVNQADNDGETPLSRAALEGHAGVVAVLLRAPDIDPNKKTAVDGMTPLFMATFEGHIEVVEALLRVPGIDPNKKTTVDGMTPLFVAAQEGLLDVVDALIAAGAVVDKARDNGATPLSIAAQNGHVGVVAALIAAKAEVSQTDIDGATPLSIAAQNGHVGVVAALIAAQADVNQADKNDVSPLYIAAYHGHTETVATLIAAEADVNQADEHGTTPLYTAAYSGYTEVVALLLEKSADVNKEETTCGATPLYIAANNAHAAAVDILLAARDIDVNKERTDNGATPLYTASYSGHTETVAALLAADGIDVNKARTSDGVTPLYIAANNAHAAAVDILLAARDIDVNKERTDNGETPLYIAALDGHGDVVAALLAADGIDVNKARTSDGVTPLYIAVHNDHINVVKALIKAKADLNKVNNKGITPLHIAIQKGHTEVVKALIEAGADINKAQRSPLSLQLPGVGVGGPTPLFMAAKEGKEEIVKALINAGAELGTEIKNNSTNPLHVAIQKGHTEVAKLLMGKMSKDNLDATISSGGKTFLHAAIEKGHTEVVAHLIERGADVDKEDLFDDTPLLMAIEKGHTEIVDKLIKAKANVNKGTQAGDCPLSVANYKKNPKIISSLIKAGAAIVLPEGAGVFNPVHVRQEKAKSTAISYNMWGGGDTDKLKGKKSTFTMSDIGESLNCSSDNLRIRGSVMEPQEDREKKRVLMKPKKAPSLDSLKSQGSIGIEGLQVKDLSRQDFASKDPQQDGEFHLLHYHDQPRRYKGKGYLTKLLSVHCQDQLEAITASNGEEITAIYKDEDGFYHIQTDKKCSFDYVLKVPPAKDLPKASFEKGSALEELMKEYNQKKEKAKENHTAAMTNLRVRGKEEADPYTQRLSRKDCKTNQEWLDKTFALGIEPGDIQFPRVEFKSNQEWLEAIYESGGGSCRDRVKAFDYMAKRKVISADSYRIVRINNNHVAMEVKDSGGNWCYSDLGGRNSNIEKSSKKLQQKTPSKWWKVAKYTAATITVLPGLFLLTKGIINRIKSKKQGSEDQGSKKKGNEKQVPEVPTPVPEVPTPVPEVPTPDPKLAKPDPEVATADPEVPAPDPEGQKVMIRTTTKRQSTKDPKAEQQAILAEQQAASILAEQQAILAEQRASTLKESLKSSIKLQTAESFEKILASKAKPSLLVTQKLDLAANALIKNARFQARPVFYIDNPGKIDIFKRVLSLEGGPQVKQSGFLADFLSVGGFRDPVSKPVIIINWDAFTTTAKVTLNTILDEKATIQGRSLANIQIIGLSKELSTDTSFLSRQDCYQAGTALESELKQAPSAVQAPVRGVANVGIGAGGAAVPSSRHVDLEGYSDWRQKLFGEVAIIDNFITYDSSDFVAALKEEQTSFEFKNISAVAKKELQYEFAQAQASGFFRYQGLEIKIPEGLEVKFAAQSFDFKQFAETQNIKITSNKDITQAATAAKIINTRNFDLLLHDKQIVAGAYSQTPGLIQSSASDNLNLLITSPLSEAQYYCLFNEAQKHEVQLNIELASNVQIPEKITQELGEAAIVSDRVSAPSSSDATPSPSPTARRQVAQVIVTNDANQHLDKHTIPENALILDIEDYSYSDLVEAIDFRQTATGFDGFAKKQSQLIQALKADRKVILKGQFCEELLQDLQTVMIDSAVAANLTIIHEERDISLEGAKQQFAWLDIDKVQVSEYKAKEIPKKIEVETDPLGTHPAASVSLKDSVTKAEEFIQQRKGKLTGLLADNPVVYLTGPSGVGKSSLMRDIDQDTLINAKLYNELSSLKTWAEDKAPGKSKILFIDEANIDDRHFTMFAPLLRGHKPEDWPVTILHDGELIELTAQHKVVLAGNPISYGGGRNEQKLFTDYPVPTFEMKDFKAEYIYEKLLKAAIFDQTKFEKLDLKKEDFQTDFQDTCQGLIMKYLRSNKEAQEEGQQSQVETVRELQAYALNHLAEKIIEKKSSKDPATKDSESYTTTSYVSTTATKPLEAEVKKCLDIRKLKQSGMMPPDIGLGGAFLEGGSGIGKSSIIAAMIGDEDFVKIDASMPSQKKIELLTKAFEEGKIVQIDELNSCIEDGGLEKSLNAVLTGHHPETGKPATTAGFLLIASANKASMAGRAIIGPALRHRMHCPKVPELRDFQHEDITAIVGHWLQQESKSTEEDLKAMVENWLQEEPKPPQASGPYQISELVDQIVPLLHDGKANLRDLKNTVVAMSEQGKVDTQGLSDRIVSEDRPDTPGQTSITSDISNSSRESEGSGIVKLTEPQSETIGVGSRPSPIVRQPSVVRKIGLGQEAGVSKV